MIDLGPERSKRLDLCLAQLVDRPGELHLQRHWPIRAAQELLYLRPKARVAGDQGGAGELSISQKAVRSRVNPNALTSGSRSACAIRVT